MLRKTRNFLITLATAVVLSTAGCGTVPTFEGPWGKATASVMAYNSLSESAVEYCEGPTADLDTCIAIDEAMDKVQAAMLIANHQLTNGTYDLEAAAALSAVLKDARTMLGTYLAAQGIEAE